MVGALQVASHVKVHGGQGLYDLVYAIVVAWGLTTQEIEGVNSTLKYTTTLAPNISFRLLSSRITVKKLVNMYKSREARDELLEDMLALYDLGEAKATIVPGTKAESRNRGETPIEDEARRKLYRTAVGKALFYGHRRPDSQ